MTALSIVLLVGLRLQIQQLESHIESIGLDNVVVIETIGPDDLANNLLQNRFNYLQNWGNLIILEKLPVVAHGGGKRATLVSYGEKTLPALSSYLNKGYSYFLLTESYPEGALIDFEIKGQFVKAICLAPDQKLSQVLPSEILFVPLALFRPLTENGFSRINYLQCTPESPSLKEITKSIQHTINTDRSGNVDVKSALAISEQLANMKARFRSTTFGLSMALGAALSLIYGTLSLLEFRQSMYISALLNSFGANKLILFMRTVIENLLIANLTSLGLIYALYKNHHKISEALRHSVVTSPELIKDLYWGDSTIWLMIFINIGVALSCVPVMLAMRKQVGLVLS